MRAFKSGAIAAAAFGIFGLVASAELSLAQRGALTMDDTYAQMGGMTFQVAKLPMVLAKKA
ncbi:hypothetical protein [Methylobacterium nigriterrae]|uniref:hypothetical protein n=1 Tax=Methylobacterium nigriterrae TaxID=3127512 RepID=UPI0030141AFA